MAVSYETFSLKIISVYIYIYMLVSFHQVSQALSNTFLKISLTQTLREALSCMRDGQQNCVLVVDAEDSLEGILTDGDIKRWLSNRAGDASSSDPGDVCFYLFLSDLTYMKLDIGVSMEYQIPVCCFSLMCNPCCT